MADVSSIWVHRVGNVISGYCIRLLVILFSALAVTRPKVHKKALVSYVGCGLVWSAVELAIVLVGNRAGPMTLTGNLRYAGAFVRGFSEGAAVAGCALVPGNVFTILAAGIIIFDAATVYEGASEVSRRLVTNPRAYIFTLLVSALWVFWRPNKGAYPAKGMWIMTAYGFLWNVVAMTSGARVVKPAGASLLFAVYDALFEIGLLYAALSQVALYTFQAYLDDDEAEIELQKQGLVANSGSSDGTSSQMKGKTVSFSPSITIARVQSPVQTPVAKEYDELPFPRAERTLSEEERGAAKFPRMHTW